MIFLEISPKSKQIILPSAAILRFDFTVKNWARSCHVIRIKKIPDLASTRFLIQSGERIQKVPDSPANSPDKCERKAYPKRKSCRFKSARIRVDRAFWDYAAPYNSSFASSWEGQSFYT